MASKEEIIAKAKASITEFDEDMAAEAANESLAAGVDPVEIIEHGYTAGMLYVGEQFEQGTLFLPHVLAAAEAMKAGVDVLTPEMEKRKSQTTKLGTVVIGTIEGDIHSIGKDIVASMLNIAGFEVVDLGRDVPIKTFVEKAKELKPDIVASSALMTTTMVNQIQIEEQLKEAGVRDKVKTMVGGAPVTQDWADKIGANIYGESATDAVTKVKAALKR
ncbi:dimethylamine corrinoid protein 3 [Methanosarcina sp. 2.H.T.1A.6]|uniref:cobalamin B12-binding domain-containing protein n=1 Tax=unclassified Methanosarcina TaxID=2644672 RepID=UPI00062121E1|nr:MULTISPECIES: B12-binding domain-containing protein [unclassified Methanosarcina]KKG12108.1 dimethylamine corrinoid protein 3 [Methanosarcina sp. 2.H.T.1A.15]KKG13813.1 dimethylamine corrinoid protein 3 [Methanosarcina sp. 2.H.T.1A.3]KKG23615.1 dimethylamine corrinoid protein 3 [Methanosarcina sp. 2.H.T.1A.8]KKG23773.1 dimethylamine corrinoid protein 3 [Methanosarcina sp. 2.H.T.1A.6]KKH49521.1 dimethylamine corrinoid protein 3 [Methanosarcina sp. 1.H.A.2.2]